MAKKSIKPPNLPGHRDRKMVTLVMLQDLDVTALLDYFASEIEPYMVPETGSDTESEIGPVDRWGVTIDRIPDLYAWAHSIRALYDELTVRAQTIHGQTSPEYKGYRLCRDAAEGFCSVVKMRYQAASRMITIHYGEKDEMEMSRQR